MRSVSPSCGCRWRETTAIGEAMSESDKSDKGWPDDGREWRELTDLDRVKGEWVAREIEEKAHEEAEHYRHAHSKDPIDGILNSIFGTSEECNNPRCRSEERHAEFEAA